MASKKRKPFVISVGEFRVSVIPGHRLYAVARFCGKVCAELPTRRDLQNWSRLHNTHNLSGGMA